MVTCLLTFDIILSIFLSVSSLSIPHIELLNICKYRLFFFESDFLQSGYIVFRIINLSIVSYIGVSIVAEFINCCILL